VSLDIGTAVSDGLQRSVQRNGLVLMAIFVVIGSASTIFSGDLTAALLGDLSASVTTAPTDTGPTMAPMGPGASPEPILGLPAPIAGVGWVLASLAGVVANVVAIRVFVSDETEHIPREFLTRNLLWVTGNLIVGGIAFAVLVGIGLLFLIVPGLFLLVSLYFWNFVVITEDEDFITGLQRSWALTEDDRLMLFVLGVLVTVAALIIGSIGGLIGSLMPQPGSAVVSSLVSAPLGVVSVAIAAQAFRQLRGDKRGAATEETPAL
jgi:hypothetical protein